LVQRKSCLRVLATFKYNPTAPNRAFFCYFAGGHSMLSNNALPFTLQRAIVKNAWDLKGCFSLLPPTPAKRVNAFLRKKPKPLAET